MGGGAREGACQEAIHPPVHLLQQEVEREEGLGAALQAQVRW